MNPGWSKECFPVIGAYILQTRVSNGTEFFCPAGQRDRHAALVPGQRDSGTRKLFLSRDKGTTGQAQNVTTGRDGPGFFETVPSRPGTSRGTKWPSFFHIIAQFRPKGVPKGDSK